MICELFRYARPFLTRGCALREEFEPLLKHYDRVVATSSAAPATFIEYVEQETNHYKAQKVKGEETVFGLLCLKLLERPNDLKLLDLRRSSSKATAEAAAETVAPPAAEAAAEAAPPPPAEPAVEAVVAAPPPAAAHAVEAVAAKAIASNW